jgi:hypothetical protein
VVVECEQIDAPARRPLADFTFRIQIVGLVAQVEAGIRRKLRPQALNRFEQCPCAVAAAKARHPRPSRGVKDRGDAVADRLTVAVGERHIDRKTDAGAGHHLPLERVAMQIDDARQHHEIAASSSRDPRP